MTEQGSEPTTEPCEHDTLGCRDRTPHEEHTKVGDGRPCCGWPPACRDEPTAEELTEAEREAVRHAARCLDCGVTAVDDDEPGLYLAVERILADRLAAVQAERDESVSMLTDRVAYFDRLRVAAQEHWRTMKTRAESAEAERDAALDRVKALADEYDDDYQTPWRLIRDLRAAVEGGRS